MRQSLLRFGLEDRKRPLGAQGIATFRGAALRRASIVMAPEEFRAKARARDRFVTRVLREPKIMLKGQVQALAAPTHRKEHRAGGR